MNKTVTINLSGIIFHIDEDAYLKLSSYLSTIKGYFSESEGRDEIMADIENRIAEMLSEKISDRKQVVLMTDVDYVIGIMGKPEEFAGEQNQNETKKEQPVYSSTGKRRRVFRDTDNKILGGVCSGVGAYFNMDPLWLRLALVVAFFAFGTGILLYIILWIVIPEAKTSSEKLEMRGEDVNFSNIGKKVEEEIHSFGKKAENWGNEVKQTVHRNRDLGDRIVGFITSVFGAFFRVFAKLVAVFLILIGMIFLVGIFSSLFGNTGIIHIDNYHYSLSDFFDTFFMNEDQMFLASIALVLFAGIPLMMMVYWGVRLLLGIKKGNRFVSLAAGILWIIGLSLAIISGINIGDQFAENTTSNEYFHIEKTKCDTLYLRVKESKEWNSERNYHGRRAHFSVRKRNLISADSANIYFGFPTLDIVRSENDSLEIVIYNEANGKDKKEALHFAHNISYDITQQDSLVEFSPFFSIPKDEKWRAQQVHVEVRVPKGKTIFLSKSMKNIIYDLKNETDTFDEDMLGRRWVMGEEELRCLDCEGIEGQGKHRSSRKIHSADEIKVPEPPQPSETK